MFKDDDELFHEAKRLEIQAQNLLAKPATPADAKERIGLIQDLRSLRQRLAAAMDRVAGLLRSTNASRSATNAYDKARRIKR